MTTTLAHVEIEGLDELRAAWAKAPEIVRHELTRAMWEAELIVQRATQERTPRGAYEALHGSLGVQAAQPPQISGETILGVVGTALPYAIPVELGTKPHFPPVLSLVDWVIAKLGVPESEAKGVAFLVARKIARTGTKGVGMFRKGWEASEPRVRRAFEDARRRIADRLAPGGAR